VSTVKVARHIACSAPLQPSNTQATPLSFLPEGFKRAAAASLRVDESQAPARACTGKAMAFSAAGKTIRFS
jgi:hypothetical protein